MSELDYEEIEKEYQKISKYGHWFKKWVCFIVGHDKIFPVPNHYCWACVRCERGMYQ